jgi:hypothetical protein
MALDVWVTAIPATVFLVAMFCVPESPRWLARKKKKGEALRILARVGGNAYGDRVLQEIDETLIAEDRGIRLSEFKPVLLGIALAVLQQWCGINVIFNYAQEVFAAAGYSLSSMLSNIVVTGLVCWCSPSSPSIRSIAKAGAHSCSPVAQDLRRSTLVWGMPIPCTDTEWSCYCL